MSISIYGPQVSQVEAAQWLKNNPEKSSDPALLNVADHNLNQKVDALELSTAANNGVVILDGVTSYQLVGADPETASKTEQPAVLPKAAEPTPVKNQGRSNHAVIGAVGTLASVFGGIAIARSNPALGIGVLVGGIILSAAVGSR